MPGRDTKKVFQIGALFLVMPLLVLFGSYPKWCPQHDKPQATKSSEYSNSAKDISIPSLNTKTINTSDDETKSKHEYCPDPSTEFCPWVKCMFIRTLTNPESLFLFLAAFFTFILAGFTIALFLDGREKGRKELRAYLGIQEHRVQIVGTTPQVYLRIQNTGETPAKDVRIAIDFERRHISSSDDFPAPKYSEGRRPLAPEAIWEARRVMPEIKQHTHSINRTHRIFVWGLIEYWDIYEKEPRYVRFRFRSDELMMEGIAITGWTLATTEDGNDTT